MQVTVDQLLAEASRMALELRLKDQMIDGLTAENRQLRGRLDASAHTPELISGSPDPDTGPPSPAGSAASGGLR